MDRPPPSTHRIDTGPDGAPVLVKRASDEAGRARLRTEATVLEALAHPGVARVLDVVDDDEVVELHLAWAGSHTLATVIGLGPTGAAEVVADLAATVADVHRVGLVHRRVSPDHVVLGAGGRPVLVGFADAVRDDRADPADDVAALGALLTGLVGSGPEGMSLPERRRDRWVERGRWGTSRRDQDLRGDLLTLADRARADDAAARPTAAELAGLLRTAVGAGARTSERSPGGSPAVGPRPGPAPSARSRRPVVAALGLGAVLVAVGVFHALHRGGEDHASPPRATAGSVPATLPAPAPPPSARDRPPTPSPNRAPTSAPTSAPAPADPACPPGSARGPDVDGDGCLDAVRIEGARISVGSTTWVVGRAGDRVAVGDWDCDGTATVAVLRPDTGEVFAYDRWAEPGEELTVGPRARVAGARAIAGVDRDGDGCPELTVTDGSGRVVAVAIDLDGER